MLRVFEWHLPKREIGGLYNHFVVCGYGRVGRSATEEFRKQGLPVVVIDTNQDIAQELEDARIPHLIADATREATLVQAGITRARGLVCAVDSVALNVYITLSARAVREDLTIVARATDLESIDRLYRAGANRVIQPYAVSGRMLAAVSVRPAVIDFLDLVSITPDLRLEELEIRAGGALDGMPVGDVPTRFRGVTILAVRSGSSTMMRAAPDPEIVMQPGDVVVILGPVTALSDLAK